MILRAQPGPTTIQKNFHSKTPANPPDPPNLVRPPRLRRAPPTHRVDTRSFKTEYAPFPTTSVRPRRRATIRREMSQLGETRAAAQNEPTAPVFTFCLLPFAFNLSSPSPLSHVCQISKRTHRAWHTHPPKRSKPRQRAPR